jgi:hypothetical protein
MDRILRAGRLKDWLRGVDLFFHLLFHSGTYAALVRIKAIKTAKSSRGCTNCVQIVPAQCMVGLACLRAPSAGQLNRAVSDIHMDVPARQPRFALQRFRNLGARLIRSQWTTRILLRLVGTLGLPARRILGCSCAGLAGILARGWRRSIRRVRGGRTAWSCGWRRPRRDRRLLSQCRGLAPHKSTKALRNGTLKDGHKSC